MIRSVFAPIRSELGSDYETIVEFLEANEFGLALEHAIGTLVEEEIEVSSATKNELKKIAERFQMGPSSIAMKGLQDLKIK